MAIIKSYTDLEQSKKLAEILPIESADMCYVIDYAESNKYGTDHFKLEVDTYGLKVQTRDNIPCWSLAALLSILPDSIYDNTNEYSQLEFTKKSIAYHDINDGIKIGAIKENLVDTAYEIILKLHELNLL